MNGSAADELDLGMGVCACGHARRTHIDTPDDLWYQCTGVQRELVCPTLDN